METKHTQGEVEELKKHLQEMINWNTCHEAISFGEVEALNKAKEFLNQLNKD